LPELKPKQHCLYLMVCSSLIQPGKRKTGAEDGESSNDDEDLLEKIKRICHNYTSDEDPDYEVR
jgi:hypothetical protein